MTRTLLELMRGGEQLTPREQDVLGLAACGYSAPETAERLYLSLETVKFHRKNAIAKREARNMTHACVLAAAHGYISLSAVVEEHG